MSFYLDPITKVLRIIEFCCRSQFATCGLTNFLYSQDDSLLSKKVDFSLGKKGSNCIKGEGNDCGHARPHASRIADDLPSISPRLVDEAEEVSLERLPIKYEVEGNVDPQNCEQDGQPSMEDVLTTERSTEKTEGLLEVGDEQNDVLLALQLKGRNLILDSACPELTPHIVISPPGASDDWDAYWAAWTNRIDPQSDSNLVVPYEHCGSSPSASLPPMDGIEQSDACDTRHYAQHEQARTEEDKRWAHLFPTKPLKVFNRSNLMHTECDCVYLDNVIMAVRRHHFKAAVLTASLEAASFRKRWDLSEFLSQFERPFRWTDPAEPLLSLYSHHLGATIIDSATPYTTPHIVIQEPPPQSSYWLYENTAPSPQDCGFGYYLTVPSPFVINPAGIQDSDLQCLDATLERSCAASPFIEEIEPLTPEKLDFMDDSLPSCMAQLCDIVDREKTESSSLQFNRVATLSGNMLVTGCEVHEYDTPDDDDNLPPFDEWYQGIANRSQT
ncbi:hypothetical protein AcW1_004968 [Taiwanofungus camphoratus]|nr:hypothetical protein AcW1_004968 [Antrodia cinnamomea]